MPKMSFDERAPSAEAGIYSQSDWFAAMKSRPEQDAGSYIRIDLASDTFPCAKKAEK